VVVVVIGMATITPIPEAATTKQNEKKRYDAVRIGDECSMYV